MERLEPIFGPEDTVPVLVATSRGEVAPILGYRYVTGIAPWDPFQQAKYVADLIDDEDNPLTAVEVASLIGRDVSEVRFLPNYSTLEQARDSFELEDTERIVDEFGVAEIRCRASAAPNLYPYSTNDDLIETRNDVDATAYDFLVILSIEAAPYRSGNGFNEVSVVPLDLP